MKKVIVPLETHRFNSKIGSEGVLPIYLKKLVKYNLLPLIVSSVMSKDMIEKLYQEADGLYLTGGNDWNSVLYHEKKHPLNDPTLLERDNLELLLLKSSLNDKKPVLAICRGEQGLAIAGGGTLHQHIPDVFPNEDHSHPKGSHYETLLKTNKKHQVIIKKGTKVHSLLKKDIVIVNSYHHQAVKTLGGNFIASGFSPAGVIELIEHKDPAYFCIGIQSHPEVEEDSSLENIFAAFAIAVKDYKNNL